MRSSIVITSIALLLFPLGIMAQQRTAGDTVLKGTTIEVIQSYKPEVKQVPKPEFTPDLPPRDTSRPVFTYVVPQQTLFYTYSSLPLRPLALGRDTSKLPFPGYLKLGGGNLSTIYVDGGIGNLKGDNYETAIHLHHLSQEGKVKNQKVSLSGIEAEGTLHTNSNAWRLSLEGLRNQYHYYGYDHYLHDYSGDTVQQTFTGVNATIDVKNEEENRAGINYHPRAGFGVYMDKHDASERTVLFDLPISKTIDTSMTVGIGLAGALTSFESPVKTISNNIFQVTPVVNYHYGGFRGKLGLYPTFGSNGNSFILPDVDMQFRIPNTSFTIGGGWEAGLRQNTYKQLSSYNPYVFNVYETRQTRTDEVFGQVQVSAGNHISLSGKVSWWEFSNLPLFMNDSGDRKNFYILYDETVNAMSVQAAVQYQVATNLSVGVSAIFFNYYKSTYNRVWHEPGVRVKGDLMWKPIPALTITGYATVLDRIYALNAIHQEVKLDGVFDIGAGVEYQIIPRLSAFVNVNNLLNDKYQRWYGYASYGANIYGGLRLKF
jgi:hypothetical protein